MGSIISLSEREQLPFRHGLKRLHRALQDPLKFEAFVNGGVTKIIVIADEVRNPKFQCHFPPVYTGVGGRKLKKPRPNLLAQWVAAEFREHGVFLGKQCGFASIATSPGEREDEVRAAFALLRDTLANKRKRFALAEIGACAIYLWCPDEHEIYPDGHVALLISNFIPGCIPNADYSIVPDDARPEEAVDGIWFHS
ncbi:MAG: hypothetical protein HYS73_00155 [Parcubacteria group bacterium]|nr:hypothetical protein [Parcubacteria group bacterium]